MALKPKVPAGVRTDQVMTRAFSAVPSSYNDADHTVEFTLSTGAPVQRWFGTESLAITAEAIDLSRVDAGQAKALDTHNQYSITAIIGTWVACRIEGGELIGKLKFAETPMGQLAEGMVARGELTGVSVGYTVQTWEAATPDPLESDTDDWIATRWTLMEASPCSVPADPTAMVRAVQTPPNPTPPAKETRVMDPELENSTAPASPAVVVPPVETRTLPGVPAVPTNGMTIRQVVDLQNLADALGVRAALDPLVVQDGMTFARANEAITRAAAARQTDDTAAIRTAGQNSVITDTAQVQGERMVDALYSRMSGTAPTERGREFRGYRVVDLLALRLGAPGLREPDDIMRRASHSTSDFPLLLEAAANKFLLARYQFAQPTYRKLARKKTFNDFKPHKFLRRGDFPALQDVLETGEIKMGTFGETRETASASTKGVILTLSRQMLVNDDLNAFGDIVADAGTEAAMTENDMFYTLLLANGVMSDTVALYHATHGNLAGAGTAITIAALGAGRAAMRKQKGVGKDGTATTAKRVLNMFPSILLVGPDKELEAQQLIAPIQAQQSGNVNPFAGTLELVVDANLTGNQWYLFCNPDLAEAFIYGYLRDASAPMLATQNQFNMDGVSMRVLHDFGVGQVDFRPTYKNVGN